MDQLRALEVFRAVADQGGLAGAARSLGLSPPSVTRIVNELEAHLGTPLLHRTTRKVTLTEAGDAYLSDTRRILEELAAADDAARGAHIVPSGNLRVTASILFGQYFIAPIMREFVDQFPDVSVEGLFVDRVVNIVEEGFDIAVRIGPPADSSLRAIKVGAVRQVVCGCPSYFKKYGLPQKPEDLCQHRIINYAGGALDWGFDGGVVVPVKPRLSMSTIAACVALAKTGWGLTRVLSYQIGPDLGDGGLQTCLSEYLTTEWPIYLIHAEGRLQSAKVRAFLDLAAKRLRTSDFLIQA